MKVVKHFSGNKDLDRSADLTVNGELLSRNDVRWDRQQNSRTIKYSTVLHRKAHFNTKLYCTMQ